jgi:endonuclease/exonuclease/phosphatase family metal-dependent hydrolase
MRILTLNLWGTSGDWPRRRNVLKSGLHALRPDILALQEVVRGDGYDQVTDLLGAEYVIAHQTRGLVEGHPHRGVSIASRWPLLEVREADFHVSPSTADFPCGAVAAVVDVPPPIGPTIVVNHFPSYRPQQERERELQAVLAVRLVDELDGDRNLPVILAGDLDADPDSAGIRFLTGRCSLEGVSTCYRDAWESAHPGEAGVTFSTDNPLRSDNDWPFGRIDYILVRCGPGGGPSLRIDRCDLVFDQPAGDVWASDHFGLIADLSAVAT